MAKQVNKSDQVLQQLRAAFGEDADISSLAVFEAVALNTEPLRKGGGIFKGARASLRVLDQMASWIGKESIPLHLSHDTSDTPYGRVFHGELIGDELRVLFAVDGANHPDLVAKIDNGTLDQVSVGMLTKMLGCSKCGYNYAEPSNAEGLWTMTCDEGHVLGREGTFLVVDDLEYLFELSLVGMGAANGANIVGKSDSRLASNPHYQQRLAASASSGLAGLRLSASPKESETMNVEQMARFEAAITASATATAQLATVNTELENARARIAELEAAAQSTEPVVDLAPQLAAAVEALQSEAKTVLTACGEEVPADLSSDPTELVALIAAKRAAFAAIIPVDGASNKDKETSVPARSAAAFRINS